MILPREDIGWVVSDDGARVPFDATRLASSIVRAAERAGQSDWWLAESVAAALQQYICEVMPHQVVQLGELVKTVADVLAMLNHKDISNAYLRQQNHVEVRLDELATSSVTSAAFELDFFSRLDAALTAAADTDLALLQVCGLRACVLQLRRARRWSGGCRRLAEEIVEHVRARVGRVRPARSVSLNLAVVE